MFEKFYFEYSKNHIPECNYIYFEKFVMKILL